MKYCVFLGLLVFLALGASCSKNQIPEGEEVPLAASSERLGQPGGSPSFTVPEGWVEETPSSQMRRAQYRLPGVGGKGDAELAVFSGIGGSAQQNVERWVNQFTGPDGQPAGNAAKVSNREVGRFKITVVDVSGTYSAGMMAMGGSAAPPREGYRMLGAVVESGDSPWFLKLTGPQETVEHWEQSFQDYLSSVR